MRVALPAGHNPTPEPANTLMRTPILAFALAALAAAPSLASAQSGSASGTMQASAKVQSAVTFSNPSALNFGTSTPGAAVTVAPASGAKIMVTYNVPTSITVAGTALTWSGGSASIPVSYSCASASTGTAASPAAFSGTCAAGYTTGLTGAARTDWWIYVGGAIASGATTTLPAGDYTGTITVTGTYTTY